MASQGLLSSVRLAVNLNLNSRIATLEVEMERGFNKKEFLLLMGTYSKVMLLNGAGTPGNEREPQARELMTFEESEFAKRMVPLLQKRRLG